LQYYVLSNLETKSINCRGKLLDLSLPKVMGILNVTPDSFHDGGLYLSEEEALVRARQIIAEGGDIIDIGGLSTRPGAEMLTTEEEQTRVLPVLKAIRKEHPAVVISIDTFSSEVARTSIDEGADMINDVSGGALDDNMWSVVADLKVPYVIMHMQGVPGNMQEAPQYDNVTNEVFKYLHDKAVQLAALGVCDIIIDPGFGFGKTLEHNYELMGKLGQLTALNLPIMVGVSRKSMINKLLKTSPKDALNGTTALNVMALERGASILRVHDVREAVEAAKIVSFTHLHGSR
jgi:dihydropteroate synthase